MTKNSMNTHFLTIVIFAFIAVSAYGEVYPVRGGISELKPVDDEVTQLVGSLKSEIIKKICDNGQGNCPSTDAEIIVTGYKKQVVSGLFYFISVTVGDNSYHVKTYFDRETGTDSVTSVQGPKQKTDEITLF